MFFDFTFTEDGTPRTLFYIGEDFLDLFCDGLKFLSGATSISKILLIRLEDYFPDESEIKKGVPSPCKRTYVDGGELVALFADFVYLVCLASNYSKQKDMIEQMSKQDEDFDQMDAKYVKLLTFLVKSMSDTLSSVGDKLRNGDYVGALNMVTVIGQRLKDCWR